MGHEFGWSVWLFFDDAVFKSSVRGAGYVKLSMFFGAYIDEYF